ncbi:carboxypeptidase regulatory-like domain-containing protein [Pseudoalteromonas sp. T1lg48]|uniref:carboxypeptidase regulatory-like domain-containing protein n=1 Tax=Pseudoalteromonas sp. T1lg48 TaxID=2077100 RepID=UPI000CF65C98|nr:carboxypeptidase regulatory-like domain-containing protein [Pseudoalteromonas sp. T1lg48]
MNFNKSKLQSCVLIGLLGLIGSNHAFAEMPQAPVVGESVKNVTSQSTSNAAMALKPVSPTLATAGKAPLSKSVTGQFEDQLELYNAQQQSLVSMALDGFTDPLVQTTLGERAISEPSLNLDGQGADWGDAAVPDTSLDVGGNHVVQVVNMSYAVWDKNGQLVQGRTPTTQLWQELGGVCADPDAKPPAIVGWTAQQDRDGAVLYDVLADRWLLSQTAFDGAKMHQCVAVSKSGDPTGEWHLYDFIATDSKWYDKAQFGVWGDGYYMAAPQYSPVDKSKQGMAVVAFEREKMLHGLAAQTLYFDQADMHNALPADMDGMRAPQAGSPNYFMQMLDDQVHGVAADALQLWGLEADWQNPEQSNFALLATLATEPFDIDQSCGKTCVAQDSWGGDSYNALDAHQQALMYRLAYRNFGDHDSLVVNHTVATGDKHFGVRWYEVRNPGSEATIHQQGTYAPDAASRWLGTMAMDAVGNIALGYSVSSADMLPAMRYSGRLASDPLGQLGYGEGSVTEGLAPQVNSFDGSWGERAQMTIDPSDDCTFWFSSEYGADTDFETLWGTRIAKFQLDQCQAEPQGVVTGVVRDSETNAALAGAEVRFGDYSTIADAQGVYTLSLPLGSYEFKARAYGHPMTDLGSVQVASEGELTKDASLVSLPKATISGKVVDGSGHGWGLPASLQLSGELVPYTVINTDPISGEFTLDGYAGWPVNLMASSVSYNPQNVATQANGDTELGNIALQVNKDVCVAPGYNKADSSTSSVVEFEDVNFPPTDWTVVDNAGTGVVWKTSEQWSRPNLTAGSGMSAAADSDRGGRNLYDTELITPVISVASLQGFETVSYEQAFKAYAQSVFDFDISVDGGQWLNIHNLITDSIGKVVVDLGTYLDGAESFRLRWRYYTLSVDNAYDWYVQIDNVEFGLGCGFAEGGLLAGMITDANTQAPLAQAQVQNQQGKVTLTAQDGFYRQFNAAGEQSMSIALSGYAQAEQSVSIANDQVSELNVALNAGLLTSSAQKLELDVVAGRKVASDITLANEGSYGLNYKVAEVAPPSGDNPSEASLGDNQEAQALNIARPYGMVVDKVTNSVWVNSAKAFGGDNKLYRLDEQGQKTGDVIDLNPLAAGDDLVADLAFNTRTNTAWQAIFSDANCIHELDLNAMQLTGKRVCPDLDGNGVGGLAYDPHADQLLVSSYNAQKLYRVNFDGSVSAEYDLGLPAFGLAYNPNVGHLYVSANGENGVGSDKADQILDLYVVDLHNELSLVGATRVDGMNSFSQAGLDLDCDGTLHAMDLVMSRTFSLASGQQQVCAQPQASWFTYSEDGGVLNVGEQQALTLGADAAALAPGVYQTTLLLQDDTAYAAHEIAVTLNVNEPVLGEFGFAVSAYEVNEGDNQVVVTVQRTGGSDGAVALNYQSLDGTAKALADYQPASGMLYWDDQDGEAKSFTVKLVDDAEVETMESFNILLSADDETLLNAEVVTTVKITDNDKQKGSSGSLFHLLFMLAALTLVRRKA